MELKTEEDFYKTIAKPSEGLYKEKGSKFLAFLYPVQNTDEVKIYLDGLKKEYFDARHHCYAYILGDKQETYRVNDDGEPSGTAGKPIYGQLLSFGLTRVLCVVIRYFGGTLLGTSGLIRAYKTASEDALKQAEIIEKPILKFYRATFAYEQMNKVMKILKDENLNQREQQFDLRCSLVFEVLRSKAPGILEEMNKAEVFIEEVRNNPSSV